MPPSLRTLSALPDYSRREAAKNSPDVNVRTDRAEALATIPPDVARKVRKIILLHVDPNLTGTETNRAIRAIAGEGFSAEGRKFDDCHELALEALSHILAPYGYGEVRDMEGETPRSCKGKTVYDLNTGDSYRVTICYCSGRWYVAAPAYFLGD